MSSQRRHDVRGRCRRDPAPGRVVVLRGRAGETRRPRRQSRHRAVRARGRGRAHVDGPRTERSAVPDAGRPAGADQDAGRRGRVARLFPADRRQGRRDRRRGLGREAARVRRGRRRARRVPVRRGGATRQDAVLRGPVGLRDDQAVARPREKHQVRAIPAPSPGARRHKSHPLPPLFFDAKAVRTRMPQVRSSVKTLRSRTSYAVYGRFIGVVCRLHVDKVIKSFSVLLSKACYEFIFNYYAFGR